MLSSWKDISTVVVAISDAATLSETFSLRSSIQFLNFCDYINITSPHPAFSKIAYWILPVEKSNDKIRLIFEIKSSSYFSWAKF